MSSCRKYLIVIFSFFLIKTINIVNSFEPKYIALFQDKLYDCEDYNNDVLDFTNVGLVQTSGQDTYMCGKVIVQKDINDGTQVQASINQEVDGKLQYLYGVVGDICGQLEDTQTPWYPIIHAMGIDNCPIKTGEYTACNVTIDISEFEDYLRPQFCGNYLTRVSFLSTPSAEGVLDPTSLKPEIISCHESFFSIIEVAN